MLRSADDWDGQHFAFRADDAAPAADKVIVPIDDHPSGPVATIPDAHLLFNADFKRAGSDLILDGQDGKSAIVHDYFATDKRATLLSPEGAALAPHVVDALAGPLAPGQYAQAGGTQATAQAVGRVAAATGNATIVRNGVAIAVHTGDAVMKGDVLQTGSGTLGVTFNDGSTVNLTANARLVVNEFIYDPNGKANSEILDLVQGSLTFISGHVAHTGDMKIGTPVATMGIRGTVGGVSEANDGSVHFYVSQSERGAVIIDSNGTVIANVTQDGPLIVVHPVGPLQVLAEEVQKSPAELAAELAALQHIVNIQAVGQQIIQQFLQPNQNQNNPQSHGTDHTQIQIDIPKSAILPDNPDAGGGNAGGAGNATVTITTTTTNVQTNVVEETQQQIIVPIPPDLPPVNFGPQQQTTDEDNNLVFTGANAISVFDKDTPQLSVVLTATHGTLSLSSQTNLTFATGDGTDDVTMTFSGSQAAINAALDGLTFTPTQDYSGPATVEISTTGGNKTATDTFNITVQPVNDAPVPVADTAAVSEEGLPGGIADNAGAADTTDSPMAIGTIVATDAENDALTFTLGQPTTPLTSHGVAVTWEGVGTQLLTGKAGQDTVITVSIDPHSGAYTVTLVAPVDNADGSVEDVKTIDVPVDVTDGQAMTTTSLTVNIEDDRPVAVQYMHDVTAGIPATTVNLVILLDISGSMAANVPGTESTRLELAQSALHNLLTTTDVQINQVMAVSFGTGATVNQDKRSFWTDAASADNFIHNLTTGGSTYYDVALDAVANRWGPGPSAADKTLVYFISDGQPTAGHGANTATWETFLTEHGIDASYAIGIGTSINDGDLTPIAWTPDNPDSAPIILNEANGLDATLQNTVLPADVHNILADNASVGFGADGGHIFSVEVDGVTYTWNGADTITKSGLATGVIMASMFAVDTALGGHFEFHFAADGGHAAGDWSYVQPDQVAQASQDIFHYVLTDTDGDHVGADIVMNVNAGNYAPVLDAHQVVTADVPDTNSTVVTGLAVSDSDANAANDPVTLSATVENGTLTFDNSVQNVAINGNGGSVPTVAGTLDSLNALFNAGVVYTPVGSPENDKVVLTAQDQLGGHDSLTFVFNVNEPESGHVTLQGTPGKDVIFASGVDGTLTGNGNSDTFVFAANAGGNNHITDFSLIDDFLQFHHSQFADIDAVLASAASDGAGNTVITAAAETLTLDGVDHAQFQTIDHSHILIV